ncbi:hypothetical protein PV416_16140 [Streptomyces ipomoeae]|uniref:hypothetical protein n=1 Tax=Streptomyces ipomoeae TaxID=103232 RepID=UPI00131A0A0A|nr:hypothetical protein [Streptomyces ipomoeae]MDX2695017.1 hypothetical protein [Streptomyces ipomoeae]MDX2822597.1 hypothetical protein [Streptomyces ipomoeae]MDX2840888.1 hypothetical protein [Streptomyces ipomoeae]MDX2875613.1 hypothetical protein [Streptomyces ipomoeae]
MTRNQWIALGSVVATFVAALITAAAMLLAGSGGIQNNCSGEASQCAGEDNSRVENVRP